MDIRTSRITSRKASAVARVLCLKVRDVRGKYVMSVAQNLTLDQAREIAYILEPERAAQEEERAIRQAEAALDNPGNLTREQADRNYDRAIAGSWALGQ